MPVLTELFDNAETPQAYVQGYCDHLAKVTLGLDFDAIANLAALIETAGNTDKTIFLVANGGSAAVSAHYVNDLSANNVVPGKPGYRVMSLTDNGSSLTALGNDASFEEVFERQLMANMRQGDLVIFMSVSGNSPNLVRAAEYVNTAGAIGVACTGMAGGKLREICPHVIHTPSGSDEYGPIEDVFGIIMHIVTGYITMKRGKRLSH